MIFQTNSKRIALKLHFPHIRLGKIDMIILVIVKSDKDSSQIITGQLSSLEDGFLLAVQIAALPGKKMYFSGIFPKAVQTQLNRDLPSSLPCFYFFSPSLGRNRVTPGQPQILNTPASSPKC